jgi:RNA polymerase sigma-70 factor (ECF subfamily)
LLLSLQVKRGHFAAIVKLVRSLYERFATCNRKCEMMRLSESETNQSSNRSVLSGQPFLVPDTEHLNDSDYVLARAAAAGTNSALGDLYYRHRRRVHSLCWRMTHDDAEAEDLTQEVFIELLGKIGSFRGESQFTTWLHRFTVNHVLMHFRRVKRRKEQLSRQIEGSLNLSKKVSAGTEFGDRIALNVAVAKLPSGCRAVFLLFDVEGYKHEEIANIFNCSIGNSKAQLHKARRKLRSWLQ